MKVELVQAEAVTPLLVRSLKRKRSSDSSSVGSETSNVSSKGCREFKSIQVFSKYIMRDEVTGECEASKILSQECYEDWVRSRRKLPQKPPEAFRRALTAHVRGVDGRKPFPEDVEQSLLRELRKKRVWQCFRNVERCGSIGVQGFPALGFHEQKAEDEKHARLVSTFKKYSNVKVEDSLERSVKYPANTAPFITRDILDEVFSNGNLDFLEAPVMKRQKSGMEFGGVHLINRRRRESWTEKIKSANTRRRSIFNFESRRSSLFIDPVLRYESFSFDADHFIRSLFEHEY